MFRVLVAVLCFALLLRPSSAHACLEGRLTVRTFMGFQPGTNDYSFAQGTVTSSPAGCLSTRLSAVRYAENGDVLHEEPLFPKGLPGFESRWEGAECEARLRQSDSAQPLPSQDLVLGLLRSTSPFVGLTGPTDARPPMVVEARVDQGYVVATVRFGGGGRQEQSFPSGALRKSTQLTRAVSPNGRLVFVSWTSSQGSSFHRDDLVQTRVMELLPECRSQMKASSACNPPRPAPLR
jgi:hypothetical protein